MIGTTNYRKEESFAYFYKDAVEHLDRRVVVLLWRFTKISLHQKILHTFLLIMKLELLRKKKHLNPGLCFVYTRKNWHLSIFFMFNGFCLHVIKKTLLDAIWQNLKKRSGTVSPIRSSLIRCSIFLTISNIWLTTGLDEIPASFFLA